jgi:arabinofuranan 3-O-arabinosyltransferase
MASSEGVLFIDSDMILPPTLVHECETGLRKHDALIIPEKSIGSGFWAQCKAVERRNNIGDDQLEAPRCFQKSALAPLGGYSTALESGEDWDLHNRAVAASLNIGRANSAILHDEGRLSILNLLRKKYRYGKSFGRYLRANPNVGFVQVNPWRRIVRPSLRAFASTPKYGIGILVMTSLEFAAAGLGHLVGDSTYSPT